MMLDRNVTIPEGWQTAWLDRTYRPLVLVKAFFVPLATVFCALEIFRMSYKFRRIMRKLKESPNQALLQEAIQQNNKVKARGSFVRRLVAYCWHFQAFVIFALDCGIAIAALMNDADSHPEVWGFSAALEIASYASFYLSLAAICFMIVPVLALFSTMYMATSIEDDGRTELTALLDGWVWLSIEGSHSIIPVNLSIIMSTRTVEQSPRLRLLMFGAFYGYAVTMQYCSLAGNCRGNRLRNLRLKNRSWNGLLELLYDTLGVVDVGPRSYEDVQMRSLEGLERASKSYTE